MTLRFRKVFWGLWSLYVISVFVPVVAEAAFSLSVAPYEGGYDLRFGKVSSGAEKVNKEVTVRMVSDSSSRYQLIQSFFEPPSTPDGNSIPPNSFLVYALRGTNQFGTVNVEQGWPLSSGRQILYTSNNTGEADSFTLVYGLNLPQDISAGLYRGRIGFSLEAIDSNQPPAAAIMNIEIEVESNANIKISTLRGTKNISLKPGQVDTEDARVVVTINGSRGHQFSILQVAEAEPVSEDGALLEWAGVQFKGLDGQSGTVMNTSANLSDRQQTIYTSSPRGEADVFSIQFDLGDISNQKAGTYRSRIKYILEDAGSGQMQVLDTIDLEIENPRVFDVKVSPENGAAIRFNDVRASQPPQTQEVVFEIKTNISQPYQVTQNAVSLLVTKDGTVMPEDSFTLRQEGIDTKGVLKYPQKTKVQEGQMVLFVSDRQGSPDKFKVIYELVAPRDVHPGDYSTVLSFYVSEI